MSQLSRHTPLPVIVGCGGINSAGRVSFNHAYRRLVIDRLDEPTQAKTYESLARLMGVYDENTGAADPQQRQWIRDNTLVRRIEGLNIDQLYWHTSASLQSKDGSTQQFVMAARSMPQSVPEHWQVSTLDEQRVLVQIKGNLDVKLPDLRPSRVTSGGQLPKGFEPSSLYPSRNHPRGLQLTIYGASDAIRSTGFTPDDLKRYVRPDHIAVYSGSAMGQLDQDGYGGMMQNSLVGKRPTAKNAALGLPEMPGDFVNAYVLGSVGETAGIIGACATFLYNVKRGMEDIRSGSKRVVMVGNAEAPIVPSVIEGYRTMGALAEDETLMGLDGCQQVNNRRACRPFSSNAGFTLAESSVWIVLMDDALAMELGARVLGSVGDVNVNADGFKKSIPGPGIGNYVTVAKCMATARAILGDDGLRNGTYIHAHGTGTPQNRVTESDILSTLAKTFAIDRWPVAAIKSYLGHSLAPAGGDQLAGTIGAWHHGWIPGIKTIDHIADDVAQENLLFPMTDLQTDQEAMRGVFINSKGFGGNNATGLFLSPTQTHSMLHTRWGAAATKEFLHKQEEVAARAEEYNKQADSGNIAPIYQFGEGVLSGDDLDISRTEIKIPGFEQSINLDLPNPYDDMLDQT